MDHGKRRAGEAGGEAVALSLRVAGEDGRVLNPAQRRFAKLLRKVETLRAERGRVAARWERFAKVFEERIRPEERRMTARRKQVVRLLAERRRAPKGLGAGQRERLEALLAGHLRELREAGAEGFDAEMAALWAELFPAAEERDGEGEEAGGARRGFGWKDRRGEGAAAEGEVRREEERKRATGTIYKQLAKALHPDLEQDPAMRERKHVLMQELTRAQREGDLHTLLRLEAEWLAREEDDLAKLGDETLGRYAELLEEQVEELQAETRAAAVEPRFAALARFMGPEGKGPDEVERVLLRIRQASEALRAFRDALGGPQGREVLRKVLEAVEG